MFHKWSTRTRHRLVIITSTYTQTKREWLVFCCCCVCVRNTGANIPSLIRELFYFFYFFLLLLLLFSTCLFGVRTTSCVQFYCLFLSFFENNCLLLLLQKFNYSICKTASSLVWKPLTQVFISIEFHRHWVHTDFLEWNLMNKKKNSAFLRKEKKHQHNNHTMRNVRILLPICIWLVTKWILCCCLVCLVCWGPPNRLMASHHNQRIYFKNESKKKKKNKNI